ncbi:MAG: hypothetical protein AAF184_11395 [Pseudomonadota bacterium]
MALGATASAQTSTAGTAAPPSPPSKPCAGEAFRAFDFWLGDWQVRTADGNVAGVNRITRREGNCVLLEQWTGASGSTGMSMNFYSPASDRWRQVWHSASGALIDISGGWTGESMVLTGTIEYVGNATTQPFRGTWTPLEDGRVRQFFEQSGDDGETWQAWFEGFYARRESPAER